MTTTLLSDFLPRPRPVPRWSRPRTSSGGFVLRRSLLHCLPVLCTLNNSELCEARGTTVELVRFSDSSSPPAVIDSTLRCTISTRNISCALNFFVLDYSDKGNCTYITIRDRPTSNKRFRRCTVKIFLE